MTKESTPSPTPSFGRKLLRALGWLAKFTLRLVFVIVVGALLGFGVYWSASNGVALINRQVFQPIQRHTIRLDDLESRYAQDYQRMNERTQALQERIDTLESRGATMNEALSALQTRLTTSETLLGEMQTALDAAQENLSALETRQDAFEPDITELKTALAKLDSALAKLDTAMGTLSDAVAQTADDVETLSITVRDESPLVAVRLEVQLLRAMELLTRARLQLALDNAGLAATEVQEARDLLLALAETLPADQQEEIEAIVLRLELGLANLPDAPRLASDDFEIAWQLLTKGLTSPTLTATETVTPTETQEP